MTAPSSEHMLRSVGRPHAPRRVGCRFGGRGFRPLGRPVRGTERRDLALDGLVALRLADVEGLYQEAAAERMGVSRSTFARILRRARVRVATAVVEEKVLTIGGGPVVEAADDDRRCPIHGGEYRRGRGCRCSRGERTD